MSDSITASALRSSLLDNQEIALIDTREQGVFGEAHLLAANNIPLSHFEERFCALVPRRSCSVVLCDDGDGSAGRAQSLLRQHGYRDVRVMTGGIRAWEKAGNHLFRGMHVPSKAFGELVEHYCDTPRLSASELQQRLDRGDDLVVLDSRPLSEFQVMSIPGAVNVPGAELVYRVSDMVRNPETTVVVNCAGRTRSIIGCQSLIDAGLPNPVFALKDGTMGWLLAGLALEHGKSRSYDTTTDDAKRWSLAASAAVAKRHGIRVIDQNTLQDYRRQRKDTTLYVFDVRSPAEFARGHLFDAVHAPGGQLVQATDLYVAVRQARIVLVDDELVRAYMTAGWLKRLGFINVSVLSRDAFLTQTLTITVGFAALSERPDIPTIKAGELGEIGTYQVVDFSRSLDFRLAHLVNACWGIRSSLSMWQTSIPQASHYVVTARCTSHAQRCAEDLSRFKSRVSVLASGPQHWLNAGLPIETGFGGALCEADDVFHRPYDRENGQKSAMQDYLDWEVALLDQFRLDGTVRFVALT